jgi:hypothetical protein
MRACVDWRFEDATATATFSTDLPSPRSKRSPCRWTRTTEAGLLHFLHRSGFSTTALRTCSEHHLILWHASGCSNALSSFPPTLTRLELRLPKPGLVAAVFAVRVLASSHSLLPNLRSLIVDLSSISEGGPSCGFAASQHTLLYFLHLQPPEDVLAGFREIGIGCQWRPNTEIFVDIISQAPDPLLYP